MMYWIILGLIGGIAISILLYGRRRERLFFDNEEIKKLEPELQQDFEKTLTEELEKTGHVIDEKVKKEMAKKYIRSYLQIFLHSGMSVEECTALTSEDKLENGVKQDFDKRFDEECRKEGNCEAKNKSKNTDNCRSNF